MPNYMQRVEFEVTLPTTSERYCPGGEAFVYVIPRVGENVLMPNGARLTVHKIEHHPDWPLAEGHRQAPRTIIFVGYRID